MSLHFNVLIYYIYWILLHFATDLAEDTLYSIVLCLMCTLLVWSEGLFVLVRSTGNGVHLFASVFCRNWCMWVCQWEYWLWKGNTSEVQTLCLFCILHISHAVYLSDTLPWVLCVNFYYIFIVCVCSECSCALVCVHASVSCVVFDCCFHITQEAYPL